MLLNKHLFVENSDKKSNEMHEKLKIGENSLTVYENP